MFSDSRHSCWGATSCGAMWVYVCVYACVWMEWGLRGSGMLGWVGTESCVWDCVCETMKAIPLSSKSLHSSWPWVIWFSAVQKSLKSNFFSNYFFHNFTSETTEHLDFMKKGKRWGRFICLTHDTVTLDSQNHAETSWIETEQSIMLPVQRHNVIKHQVMKNISEQAKSQEENEKGSFHNMVLHCCYKTVSQPWQAPLAVRKSPAPQCPSSEN